jgi:hypothetical protein
MRLTIVASIALLVAMLLGIGEGRAFTIQNFNNSNPDGSTRFADPDEQAPVQHLTNPSGHGGQAGNQTGNTGIPGLSFSITGGSQSNGAGPLLFDPTRPPSAFGPGNQPGNDLFGTRRR